MIELTDEETEVLTRLKEDFGGKVLIKFLKSSIADDVESLVLQDPSNAALHGRLQGSIMRAQELLHLLSAEYIVGEE